MAIAVFDIDGTYTQFEKFVLEKGGPFIEKKYNLMPIDGKKYDIDDNFDLINQLLNKGFLLDDAIKMCKRIKDDFWNLYFVSYCMYPFRDGVSETIKKLRNKNVKIINVSSRFKTCKDNTLGKAVRSLTKMQLLINNVPYDNLIFVPDDDFKLELIRRIKPDIAVDDKPELIEQLSKFTSTFCINSDYNADVKATDMVYKTDAYDEKLFAEMIKRINERDNDGITFQKRMQYFKNRV